MLDGHLPITKPDLIAFERSIADLFNAGSIPHPVHLAGGNEDQLIEIFKGIAPTDWVFGTWRTHYHCLLKGVPPELLKRKIVEGRSIALCFPEYRILSSAMVGGIAPIALGVAWAIKKRGTNQRVHCFLGDMGAQCGIAKESMDYASGHDLPIHWIVEDNGMSVGTKTDYAWGTNAAHRDVTMYSYQLQWPHVGGGQWVQF